MWGCCSSTFRNCMGFLVFSNWVPFCFQNRCGTAQVGSPRCLACVVSFSGASFPSFLGVLFFKPKVPSHEHAWLKLPAPVLSRVHRLPHEVDVHFENYLSNSVFYTTNAVARGLAPLFASASSYSAAVFVDAGFRIIVMMVQ